MNISYRIMILALILACFELEAAEYASGEATTSIIIQAPVEDVNSAPIPGLSHITVYWGESSRNYNGDIIQVYNNVGETVEHELIISYIPPFESEPFNLYFAATATNLINEESGYSNELRITFTPEQVEDTVAPDAPILQSLDVVVIDNNGNRYLPVSFEILNT